MAAAKKTEKTGKTDKNKPVPKKRPAPVRKASVREPLLTESRRRIIRIALGVLCGILTLYTLAALLSFVFTWTSDQSLSFDPQMFSMESSAENAGGKIGYLWANLLISKWFGLGAFAIPVFLGFLTVYCFRIKKVNLFRIFLLCAFGAIIFSVLLAYIFSFTSFDAMFGSGAGGSYGHYANRWMCDKLGKAGMAGVLLVVLFLYACLLTPKVAFWLDDLIYGISHREPKTVPDTIGLDEEGEDGEDMPHGLVVEGAPEADVDPTDDWLDFTDTDTVAETESGTTVADKPAEAENKAPEEPSGEGISQEDVKLTIEGKSEKDIIAGLSDEEWRERYDPRLDLPKYKLPPMSLLNDYKEMWYEVSRQELENNKQRIVNALNSYKIRVKGITAKMGPTVTLYKIQLDDGIKVAQVRNLEEDIAISLGAKGIVG